MQYWDNKLIGNYCTYKDTWKQRIYIYASNLKYLGDASDQAT